MNDCSVNFDFSVNNLGSIREGQLTQKPLTIFCGPNNSGKTWTMYSLYHCYQWLRALKKDDTDKKKPHAKKNPKAVCIL